MVLGFRLTHKPHRGSVLPHIVGHRTRDGMKVSAGPPKWQDLAVLLMATSFLLLFGGLALFSGMGEGKKMQAGGAAISFGAVAVELGRVYFRQRRLKHASLTIRPWPIRLGDRVETIFRSIPQAPVTAKLMCVEEVKVSSGKYESVNRATRFEVELHTTTDRWEFEIPAEGLPSFTVKSNRVQWVVKTVIDGEINADFELLVIPEVAS